MLNYHNPKRDFFSALTLREGPPLFSVFSPQGRRGNRSSSSLVTISFYCWRTIRGLRQQRSCGLRYATAWIRIAYRLLAGCLMLGACLLLTRCLMLGARCLLTACLMLAGNCCYGLFGKFFGQHVLEEEGVAEDVTTPHTTGLLQETVEPLKTVGLPP